MLFKTSDQKEYDLGPEVWQRWDTINQMLRTCGYHEQCRAASQAGNETPEKTISTPLIVIPAAVLDLILAFVSLEINNRVGKWPPEDETAYELWRATPEVGYEAEFLATLSDVDLFRVYMAADYLDHKHLLESCARVLAGIARADVDRYASILDQIRMNGGNIPSHLNGSPPAQ